MSSGYDTVGKQIRHSHTIEAAELAGLTERQKEKEIERQKVQFEQKIKNGTFLDGEKITFAEFAEKWLVDYAEPNLAPSTLNPYKLRLEKRIIPALGHIKLSKIQPHHLIEFYKNLSEDGMRLDVLYYPTADFLPLLDTTTSVEFEKLTGVYRKTFKRLRDGKGVYLETAEKLSTFFNWSLSKSFYTMHKKDKLSNKTIHHHHNLISAVLSTAVEWNLIQSNPAERVENKKQKSKKAKSSKEQMSIKDNYYDDEQVCNLFVALASAPIKYKTIIYLTIDTGLRLSEVAGLEWSDVDIEKKELDITRQRQYVSGHGIIESDPKSESGVRGITISDMVIDMLKEYKKYQLKCRIQCGELWHQSNNIFTHEDGKPIFPNRPSIWFAEFLLKNNLPKITFHGLRHTNASLLIAEGIDIVTLSTRLGHSDKNITLNTYSHVFKSQEKKAANKMDNFYSRIQGNDTKVTSK